jgi:hypothetical protein
MRLRVCILAILASVAAPAEDARGASQREMVIVIGAEGEPIYQPVFRKEADAWSAAASAAGMKVQSIGGDTSLAQLKATLATLPKDGGELWLVLIGHGTFDGRNAKLNLPGDDLSASELAGWLKPFQRRLILLNLFSASGAFLPALSGSNRVVLTATRSGAERNYSRFGEKIAESLGDPEADLDADGRVSLAELSARATAEVVKFYDGAQRIVPEHALLDDNGDRLGTETPLLIGAASAVKAAGRSDGSIAAEISLGKSAPALVFTPTQREQRDAIEKQIAGLRARKTDLGEDNYYRQLETLLLQMATLYDEARASRAPGTGQSR